jgi:hypothetical protein
VTFRAFFMMWMKYTVEWFEETENPNHCSMRLITHNRDRNYIFKGFENRKIKTQKENEINK